METLINVFYSIFSLNNIELYYLGCGYTKGYKMFMIFVVFKGNCFDMFFNVLAAIKFC